jgi:hypothetical protein
MWVFTPEGFYSVVSAEEFGEELQVRARDQDDLERLRRAWFPDLGPTVVKPGRDYPCRAFCTRDQLGVAMARMAHDIDYTNFKSAVAKRHGSARAHIYGNVWSDCRAIERESGL